MRLIGWFLVFSMGFYSVLSLLPLDIIGINISKETIHNIFATVSFFMTLGSFSIMSFPSKVLAAKRQETSKVIEAHEQMYAAQDACEKLEFMVEELEAICKDPSNLPKVVSLLIARERVCQDPDKKAQITQVRISAQRLRRHIKLLEDKAYK
ncbi:hypothetical protein A8C75_22620 [Marinobacterium aestuarii]|uniref:Uncharacterized protein n=1 Tax=Marinobacterium aestuarii TaxID=1821621 RepID=A0A1A9F449_9GAMM|nr:hypothetical protein A8C75_22620 [Marinobacterium aestuarii]